MENSVNMVKPNGVVKPVFSTNLKPWNWQLSYWKLAVKKSWIDS